MNKPITRVFIVSMMMFALLVGATSWWTVVDADSLNHDRPEQNRRALLRGLKIKRGVIRDADGKVIARSVKRSDGVYTRRYPQGDLFGHPIGYSYASLGQTGVEAFYDEDLRGEQSDSESLLGELTGREQGGDNLQTTIDPTAQAQAEQLIAAASPEQGGSAVALDPQTGAVKVMASVPGYDPNDLRQTGALDRFNKDDTRRPLVNRALQFGYAPGSTMKVVTLAAALDSGKFDLDTPVDGTNNVPISGVPLKNDFNESLGSVDLVTALAKSVNTAFAQVAVDLGKGTMKKYMDRFGFNKKPQLDYPKNAMSASGEYRAKKQGGPLGLFPPTSTFADIGRVGIGQDKLLVTPLQMAQVAATIANKGVLMKPHIGARLVDRDGRTTRTIEPEVQSEVISESAAADVTEAMVAVVERGTGGAAQIPGVQVAGKTGTAETTLGPGAKNKLWFIAFAPASDPEVAIAVTVDDVVGFGGDVVAPIAKQLIQTLLNEKKTP
ncbi:Penicillin-binding protein A [Paraconexibacter sp. AEG42_29]|uniref:Penicillin-binding protein A n=1 Tax=Paraconexibacter sp. AEG42_29 TaxID=2997339 RepID=A0AAU7ANJ2_9ACTN